MSRPICALTLNYRNAASTWHCVDSLLAEGIDQILIWDNSEDGGKSAAKLRTHFAANPRVHLEISPVNLGFAAGVNRGIEWLRQLVPDAWILLINNDAWLQPNSLAALTQALASSPQAVLAYPSIDLGNRILGTVYYHRLLALITTGPWPGSFPYASGCCQLIAPERYPGRLYDEAFFMYGEDVELGWRLGPERFVYVPTVKVQHEGSAGSGMGTPFYETCLVESHLLLIDKLADDWFDRQVLLLGRLLTLPARALMRALRYRSLVPLKALWEGWRIARGRDPQRRRA